MNASATTIPSRKASWSYASEGYSTSGSGVQNGPMCPGDTIRADAWRTHHDPLRLRPGGARSVWADVGVPRLRAPMEHRADPGRGVLGDHAGDAELPSPGRRDLAGVRRRGGDRPGQHERPARAADHPRADGVLVPGLHAEVAPEGPPPGPEPPALAADR